MFFSLGVSICILIALYFLGLVDILPGMPATSFPKALLAKAREIFDEHHFAALVILFFIVGAFNVWLAFAIETGNKQGLVAISIKREFEASTLDSVATEINNAVGEDIVKIENESHNSE